MTMFTCEKCRKEFTKKTNLTRHQKTHADSSQTYSCSICDKVFSRADHRKRHEAAHSYSLSCGVYGQYFNRLDILARHRAQHERPEAKQRPPMKRAVAPEPGPVTKQRRTVSPPTKNPMENPVGPDVLPEDPETRALYRQHWQRQRPATVSKIDTTLPCMRLQRPPFQKWFIGSLENRPQSSRSTCRLVFSYDIWKLVNYVTTIPARITPDFLMFHTSSEMKKT